MALTDSEKEAQGVQHVERVQMTDSNDIIINSFSEPEKRRITRKVDYRLVTTLGILYCASLMDRTNLGSAAIAGWVLFPFIWM